MLLLSKASRLPGLDSLLLLTDAFAAYVKVTLDVSVLHFGRLTEFRIAAPGHLIPAGVFGFMSELLFH